MRTGLAPWAVDELAALVGPEAEDAAAALGDEAPLSIRVDAAARRRGRVREAAPRRGPRSRRRHRRSRLHRCLAAGSRAAYRGSTRAMAVQDQASAFVVRVLDPQRGDRVVRRLRGSRRQGVHAAELVGPEGRVLAADRLRTGSV